MRLCALRQGSNAGAIWLCHERGVSRGTMYFYKLAEIKYIGDRQDDPVSNSEGKNAPVLLAALVRAPGIHIYRFFPFFLSFFPSDFF